MSLRASETTVAIATPTNNNEIPERVRDDVKRHCEVPTIHDLCTYDQHLMCCPASGSAITTLDLHPLRNDSKSFTKPVKHVVVAQPPRNDMTNYTNIVLHVIVPLAPSH